MVAAVEGQGLGGRALAAPGWSTEAGGSRPLHKYHNQRDWCLGRSLGFLLVQDIAVLR